MTMLFVAIPILVAWLLGVTFALSLARAAGERVPAAAQGALRRDDAA